MCRPYFGGRLLLYDLMQFSFETCLPALCEFVPITLAILGPVTRHSSMNHQETKDYKLCGVSECCMSFLFNTICSWNWHQDTLHQSQTKTELMVVINHLVEMAAEKSHFVSEDSSELSVTFKMAEHGDSLKQFLDSTCYKQPSGKHCNWIDLHMGTTYSLLRGYLWHSSLVSKNQRDFKHKTGVQVKSWRVQGRPGCGTVWFTDDLTQEPPVRTYQNLPGGSKWIHGHTGTTKWYIGPASMYTSSLWRQKLWKIPELCGRTCSGG